MFDLKTKVLVVDDMLTMRKIISKILKEIGFTDITEVPDGKIAFEKLSNSEPKFGLIVSDWNMPNMTGLELLEEVRDDVDLKGTPFLMVTAEAEQHQVAEAVRAGVDNYVIKPFDTKTLRAKLEAVHKKYLNKKAG